MKDNLNSHYFHAEGNALSGKLQLPFEQQIKKQAFVKLEGESERLLLEGDQKPLSEKKAQENYLSQHSKNYRLEGIISYTAAHTQVSGHRSKKDPRAFVTLATSSVENLNVLNVVTADRVVGQISTTHFPNQYSPQVTFLGTHFENLRIARHKTTPLLNLALAGSVPVGKEGKDAYYPTKGTELMASVEKQYQRLRDAFGKVKADLDEQFLSRLDVGDSWFSKQYHKFEKFDDSEYKQLENEASAAAQIDRDAKTPANGARWEGVTCSLVEQVEIADINDIKLQVRDADPIVIPPHARHFGHVIHVRDFGTIFLAELKVNHNSFRLTMIRLDLGCIADGSVSIGTCNVNGGTGKGGGR
jgi:hypothetical protein